MTVLTNAQLVLPGAVLHGTAVISGDRIEDIQPGPARTATAHDLDGDYLIPGIVDLHTDNLERQVQPRANARWPSRSAMLAHDAQVAAAGVTTVLDALCLGDLGFDENRVRTFRDGIADLDALADTGLLKSEHYLHLRCELPAPEMPKLLDPVAEHPRVRLVSLMDHCPGVGQYADIDRYRALRRRDGLDPAFIERRIKELQEQRARLRGPNRAAVLARMRGLPAALASHDDRTAEEVAENAADGIGVSEFPVSIEAATAARARDMQVVAGAPNLVRGGSHVGNVNVADLLHENVVDALASDYVPASLVEAAFGAVRENISLPHAIALISANPASMAGLKDRGQIAPGLRADLVRVRIHDGLPVVRQVWRAGERVA